MCFLEQIYDATGRSMEVQYDKLADTTILFIQFRIEYCFLQTVSFDEEDAVPGSVHVDMSIVICVNGFEFPMRIEYWLSPVGESVVFDFGYDVYG